MTQKAREKNMITKNTQSINKADQIHLDFALFQVNVTSECVRVRTSA